MCVVYTLTRLSVSCFSFFSFSFSFSLRGIVKHLPNSHFYLSKSFSFRFPLSCQSMKSLNRETKNEISWSTIIVLNFGQRISVTPTAQQKTNSNFRNFNRLPDDDLANLSFKIIQMPEKDKLNAFTSIKY